MCYAQFVIDYIGCDFLNIIVCLDDKNGMLFNKRRQSTDSVLREKVLELVGSNRLLMNEYTKKQFCDSENIITDEEFLNYANNEDYVFIENEDFKEKINNIQKIIIFRWNRVYPSDVKFDVYLLKSFKKVDSNDFKGNSHDKITMEVYERV